MSTTVTAPTYGLSTDFLASVNAQTTAKTEASMDVQQDRFLKLLTAQLKNQDPLNPLDNAQVTSQMAQISTVNGIEKLNATLTKLTSNTTDNQVMQAAAMLGREVLVDGNALAIGSKDGAAIGGIGGVQLDVPVDSAKVSIIDANGVAIKTLSLGALKAGITDFQWDGTTDAGAVAAEGGYTFKVEALLGSESVPVTTLQAGVVTGITRDAGGVGLQLANLKGDLGKTTVDAVRQIY